MGGCPPARGSPGIIHIHSSSATLRSSLLLEGFHIQWISGGLHWAACRRSWSCVESLGFGVWLIRPARERAILAEASAAWGVLDAFLFLRHSFIPVTLRRERV